MLDPRPFTEKATVRKVNAALRRALAFTEATAEAWAWFENKPTNYEFKRSRAKAIHGDYQIGISSGLRSTSLGYVHTKERMVELIIQNNWKGWGQESDWNRLRTVFRDMALRELRKEGLIK